MAAFQRFNSFSEAVYEGVHDFENDTFKVALTNTAPTAANTVFANITEVAAGNGYTAGGLALTIDPSSQTGGVYTAVIDGNITFTASGGEIGPARYLVVYNDSATNKELVAYYDYGSSLTLQDGESLTFAGNGVSLVTLNPPS